MSVSPVSPFALRRGPRARPASLRVRVRAALRGVALVALVALVAVLAGAASAAVPVAPPGAPSAGAPSTSPEPIAATSPGTSPASEPASPAGGGTIRVLARPGSAVFLDGVFVARTGDDGSAVLADVAPGPRRVWVTHPDRLPEQLDLEVEAGEAALADLTRSAALGPPEIAYDERRRGVRWGALPTLPGFLPLLAAILLGSVAIFWLSYRVTSWNRED